MIVQRLTINHSGPRAETRNIFIHATRGSGDRPLDEEYRATVSYFLGPGTASAHYVVGPDESTQMVKDQNAAWHARENNVSALSLELAQPASQPDFSDGQYKAAAEIVAGWCVKYEITPVRVMSQAERGIIGHEDSEQGRRDGKSDPGPKFDWARFIGLVHGALSLRDAQEAEIRANLDILWGNIAKLEGVVREQLTYEMREAVVALKKATGLDH